MCRHTFKYALCALGDCLLHAIGARLRLSATSSSLFFISVQPRLRNSPHLSSPSYVSSSSFSAKLSLCECNNSNFLHQKCSSHYIRSFDIVFTRSLRLRLSVPFRLAHPIFVFFFSSFSYLKISRSAFFALFRRSFAL